ncbi:HU family DNA-binding protein [uncultured Pelagimonas sp.]|uniref:HU family DNA-binding protein n=1 Tax=uncultured Pelagimonas sp. TaxID=1618102 RepID=UPI00260E622F|nr:HU family DNA-binding protein [uncultured Pelagimonas sp.]
MATTTRKTTRSTTASKTKSTPSKAIDKTETVPAASDPEVAIQVEELPLSTREEMKKKELIELAVERSGVKKRDAKPAIEAALAILGEALAEGREINMRPLGKIKVNRMKKGVNGQVINARIRQPEEGNKADPDPLAQAAE